MAGVDDVVGPGGQSVPPCKGSLGAGLYGDDSVGLGGWVGTAIAGDVVGCYVCDWLAGLSAIVVFALAFGFDMLDRCELLV